MNQVKLLQKEWANCEIRNAISWVRSKKLGMNAKHNEFANRCELALLRLLVLNQGK